MVITIRVNNVWRLLRLANTPWCRGNRLRERGRRKDRVFFRPSRRHGRQRRAGYDGVDAESDILLI